MPVFSKLKRWLCCGIGGKEIETPYEPKVVKKHLRRGLVPPAAAFRKPRSVSCPAKFDFVSIFIEHESPGRNLCGRNGDSISNNEGESIGKQCNNDYNDGPLVPSANENQRVITESLKEVESKDDGQDTPTQTESLGEYCGNDNEECIDESLVSSREDKIRITPESFEKSESEKEESESEEGGQDSLTQTELEDDTCMNTNEDGAKDDKVPIVECERSCNTSKDQTLSLKDKIAAFSSLGFGRLALYCTSSQRRTTMITKKDDEDDQHISGVTRRPRSSQRNREDSPWLEARRRTPASRFGRNLRPIYHALQQASRESRGKRHVKNADWLCAREVMKKANMKRKFRLTKKMRHCRLVLAKTF